MSKLSFVELHYTVSNINSPGMHLSVYFTDVFHMCTSSLPHTFIFLDISFIAVTIFIAIISANKATGDQK